MEYLKLLQKKQKLSFVFQRILLISVNVGATYLRLPLVPTIFNLVLWNFIGCCTPSLASLNYLNEGGSSGVAYEQSNAFLLEGQNESLLFGALLCSIPFLLRPAIWPLFKFPAESRPFCSYSAICIFNGVKWNRLSDVVRWLVAALVMSKICWWAVVKSGFFFETRNPSLFYWALDLISHRHATPRYCVVWLNPQTTEKCGKCCSVSACDINFFMFSLHYFPIEIFPRSFVFFCLR